MAGILQQQDAYKDPRASILNAPMTNKYSAQEIRNYIDTNKLSNDQILKETISRGLSSKDIANAMQGRAGFDQNSIDNYIKSQGISFDKNPGGFLYEQTEAAKPVTPTPITVGNEQTVRGQLKNVLNSNSPLMQQAATMGASYSNKRGLLNSSIGASAAQDAMIRNAMPVATQDAGTFYDASKTNSANQLQAGMFNADQTNRISMFDKGNEKDLAMFSADQQQRQGMFDAGINKENYQFAQNLDFQKWSANLDNDNRLKLAGIQAMSQQAGINGEIGKTYMNLYAQISADPNIPANVKESTLSQIRDIAGGLSTVINPIQAAGATLNFQGNQGVSPSAGNLLSGGILSSPQEGPVKNDVKKNGSAIPGIDGKVGSYGSSEPNSSGDGYILYAGAKSGIGKGAKDVVMKINTRDIKMTGSEMVNTMQLLARNGYDNIDINDVVPPSFIGNPNSPTSMSGAANIASDPDFQAQFMVPIHPAGTRRLDNPIFYIWKASASKYQ